MGDYVQVLRRHWISILVCLLLGLGGAFAYIHWAPKQYEATTAVLVEPVSDGTTAAADKNSINLDTEAQLVTATQTATLAAKRLGAPADQADTLAESVTVSVPPNTDILDITYTAGNAVASQRGAAAFAQAYLDQRSQTATSQIGDAVKALQGRIDAVNKSLQTVAAQAAALPPTSGQKAQLQAQASALSNQVAALGSQQNELQATIVAPGRILSAATVPTSPSSPQPVVAIAAGLVLGLLVGIGVAYLRHRADDVIRSPEDLYQRTRVPVITVLSGRLRAGSASILPPMSSDGRGYARLRNLVTAGLAQHNRPVVVVAGVRQGGGPVAANLAASLGRAGEDVFLICADVFGTTAAAILGPAPRPGLAEVLAGEVDVASAAQSVPEIRGLKVIGPGRDADRADALLQTRSPRKLVDQLLKSGAYVVIEAPSTADSPDAQTLANAAALAVLVVDTGQTGASEVLDACAQFESMGTPVLGAVVARYGKDGETPPPVDETAPEEEPVHEPEPVESPAASAGVRDAVPAGHTLPFPTPLPKPVAEDDGDHGAERAAQNGGSAQLVPPGSRDAVS